MNRFFKKAISNYKVLLILFILFSVIASIQPLIIGISLHREIGAEYNQYNNYTIFKNSFLHLVNNENLYSYHFDDHFDLYKYSPTFAVFFGFFALLPDWIGLNLWNLLNSLLLLFSIYYLPGLSKHEKGTVSLLILIELMTSMQNGQSNALIAGLLILAFGLLERNKYWLAALCIVFSATIKLFGIVGFAMFLLYPKKIKLSLYSLLWFLVLGALPLVFIDLNQYLYLLKKYSLLLTDDHAYSYGLSVMGVIRSWFCVEVNRSIVILTGVLIFILSLVKTTNYRYFKYRTFLLVSILIWVVIFNHKAESPTFIIAISGVCIWFVMSNKTKLNIILFILAFVLTSLSPTDIIPEYVRDNLIVEYTLKALPVILIWLKLIYEMLFTAMAPELNENNPEFINKKNR